MSKKLLMAHQSCKGLPTIGCAISQHIRAHDRATFHLIEDDWASKLDVHTISVMGDHRRGIHAQLVPWGHLCLGYGYDHMLN